MTVKKIRAIAQRKTVVKITRRHKSRTGFQLVKPNGLSDFFPTKKIALAALHAQLRCDDVREWRLGVA